MQRETPAKLTVFFFFRNITNAKTAPRGLKNIFSTSLFLLMFQSDLSEDFYLPFLYSLNEDRFYNKKKKMVSEKTKLNDAKVSRGFIF